MLARPECKAGRYCAICCVAWTSIAVSGSLRETERERERERL